MKIFKLKMMTLRSAALLAIVFLASCATPSYRTCRGWMDQGDFFSTMDSCKKCVNAIGDSNKEAVKGCAMGMDAGNLIGRM